MVMGEVQRLHAERAAAAEVVAMWSAMLLECREADRAMLGETVTQAVRSWVAVDAAWRAAGGLDAEMVAAP